VPDEVYDDVMNLKQLFFVMEYIPHDMTSILNNQMKDEDKEEC
jgi:hypothetical protein